MKRGIKMKKTVTFLLLLVLLIACSNEKIETENEKQDELIESTESTELMISAAVSLTDTLEEIKELYEEENEVELTFNLGGSGSLAQQIQQGAPVDVFISANQNWMDTLEEEELIFPETRIDLTGNSIVLIADPSTSLTYESVDEISADDVEQIAIGNPESVPAGKYTEEILHNLEMWDKLKDKLVLAKDVRQVLTYVETGNVDIGFVYESDALISDNIKILAKVDQALHEPIVYPAAVLENTENEQAARQFIQFMETDTAQEILKKYGFDK